MEKILFTKQISLEQQNLLLKGLSVSCIELISTKPFPLTIDANLEADFWLFSSQNAVRSLSVKPAHSQKIICVGEKTAQLIEKSWGITVSYYAKNARLLANYITDNKLQNILFFSGNLRRNTLGNLTKKGVDLREIIVYETILLYPVITEKPTIIVFFSPSGVDSFCENNLIDKSKTTIFSIGETTAHQLQQHGYQSIISDFPTIEACIKGINNFLRS